MLKVYGSTFIFFLMVTTYNFGMIKRMPYVSKVGTSMVAARSKSYAHGVLPKDSELDFLNRVQAASDVGAWYQSSNMLPRYIDSAITNLLPAASMQELLEKEQQRINADSAFGKYQKKIVRTVKFVLGFSFAVCTFKKITKLVSQKYVETVVQDATTPGTVPYKVAEILKARKWRTLQSLLYEELNDFYQYCLKADAVSEEDYVALHEDKNPVTIQRKIKQFRDFVNLQLILQILSTHCLDVDLVEQEQDVRAFQKMLTKQLYYIHIKWILTLSPAELSTVTMITKDLSQDLWEKINPIK